jgi:hypothetical protein
MSFDDQTPTSHRVSGSHYQPKLTVLVAILVVFVGATYLFLRSTAPAVSGPTTSTSTGSPTTSSTTTTTTPQHYVSKSNVSVQVANGTSTQGLARVYSDRLLTLGWDTLSAVNGPKMKSTLVFYAAGYEWAASEIATSLKVPSSSLRPLNHKNPVPGSSGDDIVVILGPNVR